MDGEDEVPVSLRTLMNFPVENGILAQYFCKAQQQLGKSHQLHLVLQGSVSDKSIHSLKIVLPLSWDTL